MKTHRDWISSWDALVTQAAGGDARIGTYGSFVCLLSDGTDVCERMILGIGIGI